MTLRLAVLVAYVLAAATSCGPKAGGMPSPTDSACSSRCSLCLSTAKADGQILERAAQALLEHSVANPSSICTSELSFDGLETVFVVAPIIVSRVGSGAPRLVKSDSLREVEQIAMEKPTEVGLLKMDYYYEDGRAQLLCHYDRFSSSSAASPDAGKVIYDVTSARPNTLCLVEEERIVH